MANAQSKTTFVDPPSVVEKADEETSANDDAQIEIEEPERVETAERAERAEQEPDAEARARKMGWRPKEEYEKSGRDPEKWVSAEEFVRRGENELPVLRERFRKLEKRAEKQDKQLDEGNKLLRDLVTSQRAERDKAVKEALSKAQKDRREAIATGDVPEAERLSSVIEEHKDTLKAPVPAERQASTEGKVEIPEEVTDWVDANQWFTKDKVLNAVAVAQYGELMADKNLTDTERLAKVKAEVVRRFPEKFGNARRTQPSAVESGTGGGGRSRKSERGWNDLPRDAQDIAERLIRQGAVKDRASYLKDYTW